MKLNFILILTAMVFLNCKEEVNSPDPFGVKLVSIAAEYQGKDGTIYFDYDTTGLLTHVEERFDGDQLEYSYVENKLQKIATYDIQGILKGIDSVAYLANDKIDKLYRYYQDENNQLTKLCIYEYHYNNQGEISRINYYYTLPGNITQYATFEWSNGNIIYAREFNNLDHLLFETRLNYDHKLNFKKNNPYFLFDPLTTTENNVLESELTDNTGLYDGALNPRKLVYEYDRRGYPIRYGYENGVQHFITYE